MTKPQIDPNILLAVLRKLLEDGQAPEAAEPISSTLRATSLVTRAMSFLDQHGDQLLALAERGARRVDRPDDSRDLVALAASGLAAVDDLIASSQGVFGLHLNGDPAPWSELLDGQFADWLDAYFKAREAFRKAGVWPVGGNADAAPKQ